MGNTNQTFEDIKAAFKLQSEDGDKKATALFDEDIIKHIDKVS